MGARTARVAALAFLAAAAVRAEPPLDVAGSIVATRPRLQVSVVVTNRGGSPLSSLAVVGELLGERQEARVSTGIPVGGSGSVILAFDAANARPGVHALVLQLEHEVAGPPDAAGNPPLASQRAGLLLPLGEVAPPAVRLEPKPCLLDVTGRLEVVVGSSDGVGHRVRLRAFPPRGLRADGDDIEIEVPARGRTTAQLPLVRAGAARGTRHEVVVVAETLEERLILTSLAMATVRVAPDPSLFPRARVAILVLGCLLLALALGVELRVRARRASGGRGGPGLPA